MQALPVIPWIGGKRRLADRLIPLFPQHSCYVEVFCGGAALYFLKPYQSEVEVLNDINGELINLYRIIQNHFEEFVRQFKWAFSSRQIFEWHKMTKPETLTDIQRAARFYYLQQHAFGGKVAGQNYGTAATGNPINLCRIEEPLSAAHFRLAGTNVENLAWDKCIERYDRPETFFYCDPPYWQVEGYGVPFDFDNYVRMSEMMHQVKGKVMVSINDHPDIRKAFDGHHFLDLDIKYSLRPKGEPETSQELVITNYSAELDVGLFA